MINHDRKIIKHLKLADFLPLCFAVWHVKCFINKVRPRLNSHFPIRHIYVTEGVSKCIIEKSLLRKLSSAT